MSDTQERDDRLATGCLWLNVLIVLIPLLLILIAIIIFAASFHKIGG